MSQLGIICALVMLSGLIAAWLPVSIPVSIIGIILVFLLLAVKILKIEYISDVAAFFLANMGFFFLSAGVSIMGKYQELDGVLLPFLGVIVVTLILTFAATGYSVDAVISWQERKKKQKEAADNGKAV